MNNTMPKEQITIRDLRNLLVSSGKWANVNRFDLTNREARDFFYNYANQDKIVNIYETNNCVMVWYL